MRWLSDKTVMYQIFIDRFALPKSDTRGRSEIHDEEPIYCGGTIRGIIEHFDHLKGLGVNALWLSPFYTGAAFHGYHATDFMTVDERYGTEADLRELIELVHKSGMKIVADFVPNHVSKEHPYFIDAQKNTNSPYRDWFYFTKWPSRYLAFLDFDVLPKLNLDNREARAHIIAAGQKWLALGFDGFRLDHIPGPSNDFWKEFLETLRSEFPEAEFFGEAWMFGVKFSHLKTLRVSHKYLSWLFGTRYLMRQYVGLFPALLDFEFNQLARSYAQRQISKQVFLSKLGQHFREMKGTLMLTFLDNHDMDRFLFSAHNDLERMKEVAEIEFALPTPVVIYQGTEFAMTHEKGMAEYASYGDLVARKMIPWEEGDGKLFDFYKTLIARKVA